MRAKVGGVDNESEGWGSGELEQRVGVDNESEGWGSGQ